MSNGKKKAKFYNFTSTEITKATDNSDGDTRREPGVLSGAYDGEKLLLKYGKMQGYTKEKFYKELEIEYEKMIESIEKYGGFYIGRYETGNITSEKPVVRRMNITISNQTWYAVYPRMRRISENENIQTSMIWGSLWDETLQWLIDTEALIGEDELTNQAKIATNSTSWGNYYNASFQYTKTSGGTSTKSSSKDIRIPTGSTERNKANNIYDMAGNIWEWTLEGDGSNYRYYRGGSYNLTGTNNPACSRSNGFPYNVSSYGSNDYYGFRAYFYLK